MYRRVRLKTDRRSGVTWGTRFTDTSPMSHVVEFVIEESVEVNRIKGTVHV